jgi:hypothetical protein
VASPFDAPSFGPPSLERLPLEPPPLEPLLPELPLLFEPDSPPLELPLTSMDASLPTLVESVVSQRSARSVTPIVAITSSRTPERRITVTCLQNQPYWPPSSHLSWSPDTLQYPAPKPAQSDAAQEHESGDCPQGFALHENVVVLVGPLFVT